MRLHSCSYYCDRPECVKAQRDELRDRLEQANQTKPVAYIGTGGGLYWMPNQQVLHSKPVPLYMTPPQRTPMTQQEINKWFEITVQHKETSEWSLQNWFQAGVAIAELVYEIDKPIGAKDEH